MKILVRINRLCCVVASFLGAIVITVPARATVVKYTELTSTRLPYGEAITIVGALGDLKRNGTELKSSMDIQSISLKYHVSGLAQKSADAAITADTWQVAVEKLPEKAQVQFTFQITGKLTDKKAGEVVSDLIDNPKFETFLQGFFESAVGKEPATQALHAEAFAKAIIPVVNSLLPDFEPEAKDTLSHALVGLIGPLVNLRTSIDDFKCDVPEIREGMAPSEAVEKIQAAIDGNAIEKCAVRKRAKQFVKSYKTKTTEALRQPIQTNISVTTDLSSVTEIKDFEKFAGVDVGAMYVPQIDELRSFYTVNVYLGTVEDTPAPASCPQDLLSGSSSPETSCKVEVDGVKRFLQQRLSLTFGASIGDISGGPQKAIKGDNAFLYGVGFRINKYFRITAGSFLFRSAQDDRLRNEFFAGPSIDISTLPFLRTLVGKNKN